MKIEAKEQMIAAQVAELEKRLIDSPRALAYSPSPPTTVVNSPRDLPWWERWRADMFGKKSPHHPHISNSNNNNSSSINNRGVKEAARAEAVPSSAGRAYGSDKVPIYGAPYSIDKKPEPAYPIAAYPLSGAAAYPLVDATEGTRVPANDSNLSDHSEGMASISHYHAPVSDARHAPVASMLYHVPVSDARRMNPTYEKPIPGAYTYATGRMMGGLSSHTPSQWGTPAGTPSSHSRPGVPYENAAMGTPSSYSRPGAPYGDAAIGTPSSYSRHHDVHTPDSVRHTYDMMRTPSASSNMSSVSIAYNVPWTPGGEGREPPPVFSTPSSSVYNHNQNHYHEKSRFGWYAGPGRVADNQYVTPSSQRYGHRAQDGPLSWALSENALHSTLQGSGGQFTPSRTAEVGAYSAPHGQQRRYNDAARGYTTPQRLYQDGNVGIHGVGNVSRGYNGNRSVMLEDFGRAVDRVYQGHMSKQMLPGADPPPPPPVSDSTPVSKQAHAHTVAENHGGFETPSKGIQAGGGGSSSGGARGGVPGTPGSELNSAVHALRAAVARKDAMEKQTNVSAPHLNPQTNAQGHHEGVLEEKQTNVAAANAGVGPHGESNQRRAGSSGSAGGRSVGMGISIQRFREGNGWYVWEIVEGGKACKDGRLRSKDRIVSINSVRVDALSREEVRGMLAGDRDGTVVSIHALRRVGSPPGEQGKEMVLSLEEYQQFPMMSVCVRI